LLGIRIVGTGSYLPNSVDTNVLVEKTGVDRRYIEKHAGVVNRHWVNDGETAAYMGAKALKSALSASGIDINEIDCIISASGAMQQPIPCNAVLIKEELGLIDNSIPAFDINSTCLSFVVALDNISYLIEANRYKKIAIISSEITSKGLNWEQKESCFLFGDGAVAIIVEKCESYTSNIIKGRIETYCEGAHDTEVRGGGTAMPSYLHTEKNKKDYLFDMDGRKVFTLTLKHIEGFVEKLFENTGLDIVHIDKVIPHQASGLALKAIQRKLKIDDDKLVNIIADYGNMVAASIPFALHLKILDGSIKRGNKILLIGTSAGLSIGGIILTY
jgi:3-oxoacyl-[acyl-carrier-protein] synthase III